MGHPHAPFLGGGTWAVLHGEVTGMRRKECELLDSASCIWHFPGLRSNSSVDSNREIGSTGALFPVVVDHGGLSPADPVAPPAHAFDWNGGGGMTFPYSRLDPLIDGTLRHGGGTSVNHGAKIYSHVPTWDTAIVGAAHG